MHIGIDMIGVQDPTGRGRGIGRWSESFVDRLVRDDPANRFTLYFHGSLAVPQRGWHGAEVRVIAAGERTAAQATQELVDRNPDQLDVYLVTSPMSLDGGYRMPRRPVRGPRLAAIFYDLVPIVYEREHYLSDGDKFKCYYARLDKLRDYDLLLAISEASRRDALTYLGIPASRAVNISTASREEFFAPTTASELPERLAAIGIRKPYVLSVCGADSRKNTEGLIAAFAALPASLKATHQLIIACALPQAFIRSLVDLARRHGVADRLKLTGYVDDEQLRDAYQHCDAFAFLSHYEGFGLPILEAMQCGAPVVAGNNSSQPEVIGHAGLLADTHDTVHMAAQLEQVLSNGALNGELRRRSLEQARLFSWDRTVQLSRVALNALDRPALAKPLLAHFGALPPQGSRCADAALKLLHQLRRHYTIHLYHEESNAPHVASTDATLAAFDHRVFPRHKRLFNYHAILYQLGDAKHDSFAYETLLRFPGVVALHEPAPDARPHAVRQARPQVVNKAKAKHTVFSHDPRVVQAAENVLFVAANSTEDRGCAACVAAIEAAAARREGVRASA